MDSEELKNFVENLQNRDDMHFIEGATADQIDEFEKKYEVLLPSQYKEWLSICDGGELYLPAGIQLYGIAHEPLIDIDDCDRPGDNYIVIGALSNGDPILCEKEGERISIYNHEAGVIEDDESYPDFYSFLGDLNGILGIGG